MAGGDDMVSNEADPTAGERCDGSFICDATDHEDDCFAATPDAGDALRDPSTAVGAAYFQRKRGSDAGDVSTSASRGLHACVGCGVELDGDDPSDRCDECASTSASEPLSEDEREVLWQAIWQTLADHQWADWECSCGCVRKGSGEYEDNHLADVLTDLVAAREAKARAEAGEQIAQAIEALPLIDPSGHPLHDQVTGQQMRHFAARIARLTGVTR